MEMKIDEWLPGVQERITGNDRVTGVGFPLGVMKMAGGTTL